MYTHTPNSAHSQRSTGSQAPSSATNAPRMGARELPPFPNQPAMPMTPFSAGSHAPYQYYGLLTPPASPEKAQGSRSLDFHQMVDARGPPLPFDVRRGTHLNGDIAQMPAINHPASGLLVNVGPGVVTIPIAPSNGRTITLSDVLGQLSYALKTRASPVEVANAVHAGLIAQQQVVPNLLRADIVGHKFVFAGFILRGIGQNGVAMVDCHLRTSV